MTHRLTTIFKEVNEKRSVMGRTLKKKFHKALKECPCCKGDSSCVDVTFWFGNSGFSVGKPKWAVKCTLCDFRADFWTPSGEKAVKKFAQAFLEKVALRLMGSIKKKRRKKKP